MRKTRRKFRSLIPDADKIATACGVDQERAKKIQTQLGNLLEFVVDIIAEQAELIEGQSDTAKLADRQLGRERDASKIRGDTLRFLSGDPVPVEHVLKMVFTDPFRIEFARLEHEIKIELFAVLSKAINSLKTDDKEPDK